jgi:hypothetical protein
MRLIISALLTNQPTRRTGALFGTYHSQRQKLPRLVEVLFQWLINLHRNYVRHCPVFEKYSTYAYFRELSLFQSSGNRSVRSRILTAVTMKPVVLCNVTSCGLVEVYLRFGGTCCFHPLGQIPDDSNIYITDHQYTYTYKLYTAFIFGILVNG